MSDPRHNWYATYTKPKQERVALLNLERQSFECYLPMAEKCLQHRSVRSRMRHEPLFPRYLFLKAAPEIQNLAAVRSTRGVVGLVRAGFELVKIPAAIIAELKNRMHPATGLIRLDPIALNSGDNVRVCNGPFANLEGVFEEHRGPTRSLLLLEMLGRKRQVEIDARLLKRVS